MREVASILALFSLLAVSTLRADSTIASVQQTLKDQGFFYGEITGTKDTDTTAAIRRYQIRNGLQITGELNTETRKSLGLKGAASTAPPAPAATPPRPAASLPPEPIKPRATQPQRPPQPSVEEVDEFGPPPPPTSAPGSLPFYRPQEPRVLFQGTPYEIARPELQQRVIIGAQTLLARRGYYRSGVDGEYGPGMEFAVRAYQARFGMQPNGRLDMPTLAALGLLPGQRAPGVTAPTRRGFERPRFAPRGERIYIPR